MLYHRVYNVNDTWMCQCGETLNFNATDPKIDYRLWLEWPTRHIIEQLIKKLPDIWEGHMVSFTAQEDWRCTCGDGCERTHPEWENWPADHLIDVVSNELRVT